MQFAYLNHLTKESGTVEASSALAAARKVMGVRSNYTSGDAMSDGATYHGQFRDNDDYDQCFIKMVSGTPRAPFLHHVIWTFLGAWTTFCVFACGVLIYDVELFRALAHRIIG